MDKLDKSIIEMLNARHKFDSSLVGALSVDESANALVRVRNPLQLSLLERKFDVFAAYPFIRSVAIRCELKDAIRLERMSEVEYVSAQGRVCLLNNDENIKSESANEQAKMLSDKDLTGDGVTLCVMDTGVAPHSDISIPKNRIVHFVDMIGEKEWPYDDNGHGTFVAGVAAGNGMLSGKRVRGVAPGASIVGLKVIEASGESGAFKILDGMQWLFDNFRQYGIKVVCMSFGAEPQGYADPLKLGVEMLVRSGLIVVAASGNSGENKLKSPAISPEIISVGAVDDRGRVAQFTSRGIYRGTKRPDIYAPGVGVKGISAGGTMSAMTGTSASAPYIAGACCLLCQKYNNLTPRMAKNMLLSSCSIVDGNHIFVI